LGYFIDLIEQFFKSDQFWLFSRRDKGGIASLLLRTMSFKHAKRLARRILGNRRDRHTSSFLVATAGQDSFRLVREWL